jgi:Zn finger protein HypA/HybF involved in hydrogenase expression
MASFGKGAFGSGIEFTTEIVNGKCPSCNHFGIFISLEPSYYRCTTCGGDLEQKINGIISYIPLGLPGSNIKLGSVPQKN